MKVFGRYEIRAGFLAWNSARLVTFVFVNTNPATMNKGTHFNGQPTHGQLINNMSRYFVKICPLRDLQSREGKVIFWGSINSLPSLE